MVDFTPLLTTVAVHYFWETVQSAIATPTQPTALQHPRTMTNVTAVAVKGKRDLWWVINLMTENNHAEQLALSFWFWSVFFFYLCRSSCSQYLPVKCFKQAQKAPRIQVPPFWQQRLFSFLPARQYYRGYRALPGSKLLFFFSLVLSVLSSCQRILRISCFIVSRDNKIICLLGVFVQLSPVCLAKD